MLSGEYKHNIDPKNRIFIPAKHREELGESFALREALNSFLASLDEKTRVIFMQRYFYTCTVREIAAARGLKESAVTMLLFRTRQKLREHLNREGFEL